jgi:PhnB protein
MNQTLIQPYLFFGGRCEEALEFYTRALGATVETSMRYREAPDSPPPGMLPQGYDDKIMHASFRVGDQVVMASDGCGDTPAFAGFSLSISFSSQDEARRAFERLSDGGSVTMPLGETFWSPLFGMLTDRFGLGWMVTVISASP